MDLHAHPDDGKHKQWGKHEDRAMKAPRPQQYEQSGTSREDCQDVDHTGIDAFHQKQRSCTCNSKREA